MLHWRGSTSRPTGATNVCWKCAFGRRKISQSIWDTREISKRSYVETSRFRAPSEASRLVDHVRRFEGKERGKEVLEKLRLRPVQIQDPFTLLTEGGNEYLKEQNGQWRAQNTIRRQERNESSQYQKLSQRYGRSLTDTFGKHSNKNTTGPHQEDVHPLEWHQISLESTSKHLIPDKLHAYNGVLNQLAYTTPDRNRRPALNPYLFMNRNDSTASRSRLFSTSTRTLSAPQASLQKSASQAPEIAEQLFVPESPIRLKLLQFQKSLDSASAENKAALNKAFSRFTLGPNFAGQEASEDYEADEEENNHFNAETQEENVLNEEKLRPGDLIEFQSFSGSVLGLVTKILPRQYHSKAQIQLVTSNGQWMHATRPLSPFRIKNFAEVSEYAPLQAFLPEGPLEAKMLNRQDLTAWFLPPEVSRPITEKLLSFQRKAEQIYRSHAGQIDGAFERVALPDESTFLTLESIARRVLKEDRSSTLSQEKLYAVHKACTLSNFGFLSRDDYMYSRTFEVVSKRSFELVEQVRRWVRLHSELQVNKVSEDIRIRNAANKTKSVLEKFADEVRPIVEASRKYRKVISGQQIGPSKQQVNRSTSAGSTYERITISDISPMSSLILKFFKLWVELVRRSQSSVSMSSLGSQIIKSTGLYDWVEFNDIVIGYLLLKECGVISPWQHRQGMETPFVDVRSNANPHMHRLLNDVKEEYENDMLGTDSMKGFRHDWGDMVVFCIDSADTTEIDDGISLESTSDPDQYWIHAHIANPSAFIPQDSSTAEYARKLGSTRYLPERVDRMLGESGLATRLSLQKGAPTLTISTKVTIDGRVIDYSIRSGIVNNVIRLTPEVLSQYIDQVNVTSAMHNPARVDHYVGKKVEPRSQNVSQDKIHKLSPDAVRQLNKLQLLLDSWYEKRHKDAGRSWGANLQQVRQEIKVLNLQAESPEYQTFGRYVGDPTIVCTAPAVWDPQSLNAYSRAVSPGLVTNAMILANNSAARWCAQREIPVIFRGFQFNPNIDYASLVPSYHEGPKSIAASLQESALKLRMMFSQGYDSGSLSTSMIRHDLLILDGYIQATSPLRRMVDMVNHWQIEAGIRKEKGLPGRELWTDSKIRQFIHQDRLASATNRTMSIQADRHWTTQFSMRYGLGECQTLPDLLDYYVLEASAKYSIGIMPQLAFRGYIIWERFPNGSSGIEVGQHWKVKPVLEHTKMYSFSWAPVERVA